MIKQSKIHSIFVICVFTLFSAALAAGSSVNSQELFSTAEPSGTTLIKSIRLGGHPLFTRVLINLDKIAPYRVKPDFKNKRITLTMVNARLSPGVRSKLYSDRSLEKIDVSQSGNTVRIHLGFRNKNTIFFHSANPLKSQIVLDFKAGKQQVIFAKKEAQKSPVRETAQIKPSGQTRGILQSAEEFRDRNGWKDYQDALKLYQSQDFAEAIKAFNKFGQTYPESKFLGQTVFLAAESEYNIASIEPAPDYEKALSAYKFAMRKYPDSKFRDHSLYKIAIIYEDMGYILEAKAHYLEGIKNRRKSPYTSSREIGLAKMLLSEGKLTESYGALMRILKKKPENREAKSSFLKIGQKYYERKNFEKALGIFEKGAIQWPDSLNDNPQVNYQMAEIYFSIKKYGKARKHYFNLINLAPDADNAHKALNRIGDAYMLQNNYNAALSVFYKSYKMNPKSGESLYGQIRMADIGILNPSLPVRDVIFDVQPYIQPFRTYDEVTQEARSQDILAEVTLSKGIAYLKEQNYLNAIEQFKKLLAFEENSRFHQQAKKFIRQAIVFLIQNYADQKGSLPILYAYSDYLTFSLGEIRNMKTLLQIGESYQDIGMNNEALQFYEKVKQLDARGIYTERLFLNLGLIHLHEGNFEEAELVSAAFINKYPQSKKIPQAMKLLAASFQKRKRFDKAMDVYLNLLEEEGADIREAHYLIAEIQFSQKDLSGAVESYQSVLRGFDRSIKNPAEHIQTAFYKAGIGQHKLGEFSKALHSLQTARLLFPDHSLRSWSGYLIADCFTQLREGAQAALELKIIVQSESGDDLFKKAAETRLKVINWEKNIKQLL